MHVLFVGFLGGGEAGFVHAIVDVVVRPFVGFLDFSLKGFWKEVNLCILLWEDAIKLGVEHANYLA